MKLYWNGEARTEVDAAAVFYNEKHPALRSVFSTTPKRRCTAYNAILKPAAK